MHGTSRPSVSQSSRERSTDASRQQMHHRVGRAADGAVGANRVLECLAGEDPRHGEVLLHHLDNPPARHVGEHVAARVGGGDGGVGRQRHAERLGHARHRRRGSHGHAVADRTRHAGLRVHEFPHRHVAGPHHVLELPHVGPGSDLLLPEPAVEHRAAGDHDARQIAARRTHEQRRGGLVATDEQHYTIQGIGADGFLDVHAHEVAVEHRRRPHQGLAERHHRKLEREAAHFVHAALDPLGEHPEVRVARGELRPGVADPDDRTAIEQMVRQALVLHPATVMEPVLAVLAEPLGAAAGVLLHGHRSSRNGKA